jgi:hypothetical protein
VLSGGIRGRHRVVLAALACAALLVGACKRKEPDVHSDVAPPAAPPSAEPTPDRIGPGELMEGEQIIWGFRLPKDTKVTAQLDKLVRAEGRFSVPALEEYVRQRVVARRVEVTPESSLFPEVKLRGGAPERTYRIELLARGGRTELILQDTTPLPPTPGLSEAERWKRSGMTPQGKLENPNAME